MRWLLIPLLLAVSVLSAQDGALQVSDPWVRAVPPVSRHSAGYMTISNAGTEDRRLVSVTSDAFQRAEVHESVMKDGMASMHHLPELVIPAGEKVLLAPGGYHVMLMDREVDRLDIGDKVTMNLAFDDGSRIQVIAEVRRGGGHGQDQHGGEGRERGRTNGRGIPGSG